MSDPDSDLPHAGTARSCEALEAELERERDRAREIDHRARNSLQLAGSLLMLVGRRSASPETQRTLKSLQQRIGAIAAVHRGFLQSPDPRRFDLTEHLRDQLASLARTAPEGAELQIDLEAAEIATSQAAPLALITNELVGNALAHGGPAPKVTVRLRRLGEGLQLMVSDGGPGMTSDSDASGFGLTVVRLMCQQLRAELVLEDAQPGLRAVVTAP